MFLSLSACKDLTIVHDKLPQPMGRAAAAASIAGIDEQVGGVPVAAKNHQPYLTRLRRGITWRSGF